jgi:FixJ family two-component response regulator
MAAPYLLRDDEDPQKIMERWKSLCPSEQELIMLIVNGVQNKVAASRMGVAIRTIESRRSSSMKKMGVRSVADLVRVYLAIHLI